MRRNSFRTKGRGFYYMLGVLCLVAGVSTAVVAYMATSGGDNQPKELDPSYSFDAPQSTQQTEALEEILPSEEPENENASTDVEQKKDTEEPKEEKQASFPALDMPVSGQICVEYSMDQPVFSKTLQEWRTHSGVDLEAEMGTEVKAAASGRVLSVISDPRYGQTVTIDHGSEIKTVYSNLAEEITVSENQEVKKGEVIGTVGDTSVFESLEASHLHFELLENNKPIDPTSFLVE